MVPVHAPHLSVVDRLSRRIFSCRREPQGSFRRALGAHSCAGSGRRWRWHVCGARHTRRGGRARLPCWRPGPPRRAGRQAAQLAAERLLAQQARVGVAQVIQQALRACAPRL